jgi:hypothetical protein
MCQPQRQSEKIKASTLLARVFVPFGIWRARSRLIGIEIEDAQRYSGNGQETRCPKQRAFFLGGTETD